MGVGGGVGVQHLFVDDLHDPAEALAGDFGCACPGEGPVAHEAGPIVDFSSVGELVEPLTPPV